MSREVTEKTPDHFCPGCGRAQQSFPRYPWYFCNDCLDRAEDHEGRRLIFGNASLGGGLSWAYREGPGEIDFDALAVRCLISGRPVLVTEARFGGVVAQPLAGDIPHRAMRGERDLATPPETAQRQE